MWRNLEVWALKMRMVKKRCGSICIGVGALWQINVVQTLFGCRFQSPFLLGKQLWTIEREKRGRGMDFPHIGDAASTSFMMHKYIYIYFLRKKKEWAFDISNVRWWYKLWCIFFQIVKNHNSIQNRANIFTPLFFAFSLHFL